MLITIGITIAVTLLLIINYVGEMFFKKMEEDE
jgi:hypothetical protein